MIVILDLDDTLYDESTYVKSSLRSVAQYLSKDRLTSEEIVYNDLIQALEEFGRGQIFDHVLKRYNRYTKREVINCLRVYRDNIPQIKLYDEAENLLKSLSGVSKYLLSDGHKRVQSNKVKALDLDQYFNKVILTHRYGISHAKPSTYCFKKIKHIEQCDWSQMVYVGDDPNKDFVNLTPLGVKTIRVHTGRFKSEKAKDGYDAIYHIDNLSELHDVLREIQE